ncbi:hypothetical protein, partial [Dyadobacter sp.]|uniref:hypothetical protein n=1 Tax=Dyadobacter sp. TaxID=1914288 RepID=UPI003F707EB4
YMEGFFYIMTKNAIFRLTPDTENFVQIAAVADARELVALNGKLYYVKTTSGKTFGIYKLDPAVGLALLFSPLFTPSAQMVSSEGSLYIADMGYLHKIEANGNSAHISFGWTFTTQLAALNHYNY